MRDELSTIHAAIQLHQLPATFDELSSPIWDSNAFRFHVQETYILDYKETSPVKFSDSYGSGIVRLALAFYNSFGGMIFFGVKDRTLEIVGLDSPFDIESFNRVLSDHCGIGIECLYKHYKVETNESSKDLGCILVPKRPVSAPARLIKAIGSYKEGRLWVRDRHEVLDAKPKHLPMLFSERAILPHQTDNEAIFPVHRSFPPSPATLKDFVNRGELLSNLWSWFVLGDQPRIYLHGPGGSGKSTLAFEFAKQLAEHGHLIKSRKGDRLDYVIYISAKETELNPLNGKQQNFQLRQFSDVSGQIAQILYHSGQIKTAEISDLTSDRKDELLAELFENYSGLIVIDDIDALIRRKVDTGEESLFMKSVLAAKPTKILYTLRDVPSHALRSAVAVPGLNADNEFFEFLDACCNQFLVQSPPAQIIPHIINETSGLPLLIETIVGLRKFCSNYNDAVSSFKERGGD